MIVIIYLTSNLLFLYPRLAIIFIHLRIKFLFRNNMNILCQEQGRKDVSM